MHHSFGILGGVAVILRAAYRSSQRLETLNEQTRCLAIMRADSAARVWLGALVYAREKIKDTHPLSYTVPNSISRLDIAQSLIKQSKPRLIKDPRARAERARAKRVTSLRRREPRRHHSIVG